MKKETTQKISKALQAKSVAEKMIIRDDYAGARENLLSAQKLFPAIENIGSMLIVCEILSAASIKFPGSEIDYYWVLQVMPSSKFSFIRCRYQKLVSLLHPIKRTFPGTELALKLIQDAFAVLSDHQKRSAFDLKRDASWDNYRSPNLQSSWCHSISNKETVTTAQSASGCKRNFSSQSSDRSNKTTEMLSEGIGTSIMNELNFQDLDKQHDKTIFQKPCQFSADLSSRMNIGADIDISADNIYSPMSQPASVEDTLSLSTVVVQKKLCQHFYNFENDRNTVHFKAGQIWAAHYGANLHHNYRYAQINLNSKPLVCVTWLKPIPVSPGERRWCDAGLPVACGSFEVNSEMSEEVSWLMISSYKCSWVRGVTEEQFEIYPKRGEIWALFKDWNLDDWSYNPDCMEGCKFELVEIISEFSKYLGADVMRSVKVNGFRSIFKGETIGGNPVTFHIPPNKFYIFSHNVPAYKFKGGEIDKVANGMFELDPLALPVDMIQDIDIQQGPKGTAILSCLNPTGQSTSLNPCSEDKILMPSWSQNDFAIGQVWALYCGKDFMPRQYVRVDNVVSESQVCVTFLEPLPILDHEIDWKKGDLPIVCGIFEVGGTSFNLEMSLFSYLVQCQPSTNKSFYKIYPLKGEIWAMYKNCSNNWKFSDFESYQCQIVQILSDFEGDGSGIMIARLGEVNGCLTFFHRQQYDGFDLTHAVSRTDFLSFSHRIPAFRVPGIGMYGIPEISWHLEPKALPPKYGN